MDTVKKAVADADKAKATTQAPTEAENAKAEEASAKKAYTVVKGAICPEGGQRGKMIQPGSVVELTNAEARHYMALGRLAPFIPDED